jgi:hypothetical protein
MTRPELPTSCETPLHVCDNLELVINHAEEHGQGVRVDLRTLRWLIADARTLNRLVSEATGYVLQERQP